MLFFGWNCRIYSRLTMMSTYTEYFLWSRSCRNINAVYTAKIILFEQIALLSYAHHDKLRLHVLTLCKFEIQINPAWQVGKMYIVYISTSKKISRIKIICISFCFAKLHIVLWSISRYWPFRSEILWSFVSNSSEQITSVRFENVYLFRTYISYQNTFLPWQTSLR